MKLQLPIFALFAMATCVQAQAQDPFDYHCADIGILQVKQIQTEVGITEAQRKAMNDAAATHKTRLTTYDAQQKAAKTKDTQPQTQAKLRGYFDELKKGVLTALSPVQLKRLRELTLQRAGLLALLDDLVAKKIGLTGAPYENFRKTFSDGAKQAGDIERTNLKPIFDKYSAKRPKDDAERKQLESQMRGELDAASKRIAPQIQQLQSATQQKLIGILTAPQKTAWQALLGKPLKVAK